MLPLEPFDYLFERWVAVNVESVPYRPLYVAVLR